MNFLRIALLLSAFGATEVTFATSDVNDIQSMVRRDGTHYDVVCKNGSKEVVSVDDIQNNNVCGKRQPAPPTSVTAIFSRADGQFFVLCDSKSWEVANEQAIRDNKVCGGSNRVLPSGSFTDERKITVTVTPQGSDIMMDWPGNDLADGLYKCGTVENLCTHANGYQFVIENESAFTWNYQGVGTFHFRKNPPPIDRIQSIGGVF